MSSVDTRNKFKTFFGTELPGELLIDISGEHRDLLELAADYGVSFNDTWVGIQFIGESEDVISLPATCFRENGTVFMHVVAPIKIGAIDGILLRCDTIRSKFRAQRIDGDIIVESISLPNTERGTTIEFDNGFMSASFFIDYYRDIKI